MSQKVIAVRPLERGTTQAHARTDRRERRRAGYRNCGFTLLETAVVMVIGGLIVQAIVTGAAMIKNARARDVMAMQTGAEAAFAAFQDRYHALPGDYHFASATIDCGTLSCLDGNGNGRIEAEGTPGEDILAWQHLSAARFIAWDIERIDPNASATSRTTPTNAFGGHLQIASDARFGLGGQPAERSNIKTGNRIPPEVLAEVDRKVDDGLPGSGRFQFSSYAGVTANACTKASAQETYWNVESGSDECGAATLLY